MVRGGELRKRRREFQPKNKETNTENPGPAIEESRHKELHAHLLSTDPAGTVKVYGRRNQVTGA
jgi:hypothetical protein